MRMKAYGRGRPEIKICGITRLKEAVYLNEIQAEYAGFVFWEKSKRNVSFSQAEQICRLYLTHPGVDADGIMRKMGI